MHQICILCIRGMPHPVHQTHTYASETHLCIRDTPYASEMHLMHQRHIYKPMHQRHTYASETHLMHQRCTLCIRDTSYASEAHRMHHSQLLSISCDFPNRENPQQKPMKFPIRVHCIGSQNTPTLASTQSRRALACQHPRWPCYNSLKSFRT